MTVELTRAHRLANQLEDAAMIAGLELQEAGCVGDAQVLIEIASQASAAADRLEAMSS